MPGVEPLSDQILRENREVLDRMVGHRFVRDIKADRLPKAVFERYLVYEASFVDTAIDIFALATAKAGTISQKRRLISVLDALANEQVAYFERTFEALGIESGRFDLDVPGVRAFRHGMLEIARDGTFLEIVAAMFAAEWMYWTWCSAAAACPISDPFLKQWVDLHADEGFAAQALWLRQQLDEAGEGLSAAERARLSAVFDRAQRLEIDFHEAAYG